MSLSQSAKLNATIRIAVSKTCSNDYRPTQPAALTNSCIAGSQLHRTPNLLPIRYLVPAQDAMYGRLPEGSAAACAKAEAHANLPIDTK